MTKKIEMYDELVTRIAYHIVNGVAHGTTARDMAATAVGQTLMWRKTHDDAEIKALREQMDWTVRQNDGLLNEGREHAARADRMAAALRMIANQGPHYGPDGTCETWQHWAEIARAALDQEKGIGVNKQ